MSCTTSVLMSLYWKENPNYIDAALKSLYEQTVPASEILIVYEGQENPELTSVIDKWEQVFGKDILKLIPAKEAVGFPQCLNKGLFLAKGDYIIRFDTDDICYPDRIEKQLDFFKQHPDTVLISACMEEYDSSFTNKSGSRNVPATHEEIVKYAKWRNPFNHPSVAFKREVATSLGGYPDVAANEDYAFFCTFLVKGYKAANLQQPIVKARTGEAFAARRRGKKYWKGELECLKYIRDIGFYSSFVYMVHVASKKLIRALPASFVSRIYKTVLRK